MIEVSSKSDETHLAVLDESKIIADHRDDET